MFGIEDLPNINESRELVLARTEQQRAQVLQAVENLQEQEQQQEQQEI